MRSVACIIPVAAGASVRGVPPTSAVLKFPVTWTVRTGTGCTLECREKDHKVRICLMVNMLSMDEPLLDFNEHVGPCLLLPPSGIEHLFYVVPYVHSRLILPGVDQRNLHYSGLLCFITIKGVLVRD